MNDSFASLELGASDDQAVLFRKHYIMETTTLSNVDKLVILSQLKLIQNISEDDATGK
jgi:hypothetical protein